MSRINPEFKVLFEDLSNLYFGEFLLTREFNLFMVSKGEMQRWNHVYEEIKNNRRVFVPDYNHKLGDSLETFAEYLNASKEDDEVEKLITKIILKFISLKDEKTDFSNFLESLNYSNFNRNNLKAIQKAIKTHQDSDFPIKQKVSKEETLEAKTSNKILHNKSNVFIVHGHNEEVKLRVARFLEKLKLNPIILNEEANEGLTIIEKFEKHSNVAFAIILLTHDDEGNKRGISDLKKRARQNVILELGYFFAKLGRKNVFPLYEKDVELPSDISGVLYTEIDNSDNWKLKLIRELKSVGFIIDANHII